MAFQFDPKHLRTGDILLVGSRLDPLAFVIHRVTKSLKNHAMIYTGLPSKKHELVEATPRGIKYSSLRNYAGWRYVVDAVRVKGLSSKEYWEAVKYCLHRVGMAYDYTALPGFFLRHIFPFTYNWFHHPARYFCSELIAEAYAEQRVFFRTDVDPAYISPADIAASPIVEDIGW